MIRLQSLVFLVDDDSSVRRGLSRLLKSAGHAIEIFDSAAAFLERTPHDGPACLVLDVRMPGLDGLGLQCELKRRLRDEQIVFITGHADVPMSVQAMKSGAADFLQKPVEEEALLKAIENALERSAERRQRRLEGETARSLLRALTPREMEVMRLVIGGLLNKQIAAELDVAEKTVKVHRGHVMDKLGVSSVAELVRLAASGGVESAQVRKPWA